MAQTLPPASPRASVDGTAPKKSAHHHGDLPNALVNAGIDILETEGMEGLSLRKCAARAGVSHGAPAHHFGNLAGLLDAIAQAGFLRFRDAMTSAAANGPQDNLARLKAICRGYFDFMAAHPALFSLMFFKRPANFTPRPEFEQNSRAYAVLREACAPFVRDDLPARRLEAAIWSLIHGYCALYLSNNFPATVGDAPEEGRLDTVYCAIDALVAGR